MPVAIAPPRRSATIPLVSVRMSADPASSSTPPIGREPPASVGDARTDPARVAAVRATGLLDTEVEEVFDRLTRLAVRLLGVPASFISLVDTDRDFYKSACGFGEPLGSVRELTGPTFCHFTVQRREPLVIPDTATDPAYRDVPTVRSLGVAAYVGIPLIVGGQTVGAFCTIDRKPRRWTTDEVEVLTELAASAQREIELRGALASSLAAQTMIVRQHDELERTNHQLQEQAEELEMQAEELQGTAAHLQERTQEAEDANRAKAGFLSMMSHELRTPLNAIGGYAELLAMGVRGPVTAEQLDYLSRIRRAGRHLQSLIGDILEFSRLDAGQDHFEIVDVSVVDAVTEAAELVAPTATERGIALDYSACAPGAGAVRMVRADPGKLRQILVNLLGNAIKFTPPAGRVWMTCAADGDRMRIAVSDTGRGIPQRDLARIFEPFVQLDRTSTDVRDQGVGLGLAICRELARGMEGELEIESEPGAGSTFSVLLPIARPSRE